MSLKHAILGHLTYGPATGYDLKKAFDLTIEHFWHTHQSQIYRALDELEKQSFVTQERSQRDGPLNLKRYTITEAGTTEFHNWLTTPIPPEEPHDPFLLRIYYLHHLPDTELIPFLEREIQSMQETITHYNHLYQLVMQHPHTETDARERFFSFSTLGSNIAGVQSQLLWLQNLLSRVQSANYTITAPGDISGIPA